MITKFPADHFRIAVFGIIALSAAALIWAAGCSRKPTEAVVARRDIVAYLPLDGQIAAPPAARAGILAPYDAPVARVLVTVGASVKAGDVVMELSAPSSQAYYQQARQQLQAARQSVAQIKKQFAEQLSQAQGRLSQARSTERQGRATARDAGQGGSTTDGTSAPPATDSTGAIADRTAAEQDILDIQAQRDAQLIPYEQQLSEAEQQFQEAQLGRKAASVRTPIAGVVLAINAAAGQPVKPDPKKPVATVVDLNALKLYAPVKQEHLNLLQTGMRGTVRVDELPGTDFNGVVEQIFTEKAGLLRGEKYTAVMGVANEKGQVKPGMDANASIKVGEAHNVLAVPAGAIYDKGNGVSAVKVRRGQNWVETIVETGLSDTRYTQIKSGLKEADVVQYYQ